MLLGPSSKRQCTLCTEPTTPRCLAKQNSMAIESWWTVEIASPRKRWLHLRHIATSTKRRNGDMVDKEIIDYKMAKEVDKQAFSMSEWIKWEVLKKEENTDSWRLEYKNIMRKLGSQLVCPITDAACIETNMDTLFPTHLMRIQEAHPNILDKILHFTKKN